MRKTIITCDFCGKEIDTDKLGKTWRTITWHGLIEMAKDICGDCWDERLRLAIIEAGNRRSEKDGD